MSFFDFIFKGNGGVRGNDLAIYDRIGAWWDPRNSFFRPLKRLAPARFTYVQNRSKISGQSTLDVGCGGGYLSTLLARAGARVTGIDLANGALRAARERARSEGLSVEYRIADAMHLPFRENQFDLVVCTDVLVHVPEPRKVVTEMARILRPGGRIFFSSINRTWWAGFMMMTVGERWLRIVPRGTHDPITFIPPQQLRQWFSEEGLEVESCHGIGPVGWWRGPIFGPHPVRSVMYQGIATCRRSFSSTLQARART